MHFSRTFYRALGIFLALLCAGTVVAWTAPSAAPPNGNTVVSTGAPSIHQYSTPGLGSYTPPAGTAYMVVELWGAGGGGAGGGSAANSYSGGGGQGGGYSMKVITAPSGTYYYTIGAGGAGGTVGVNGGYSGSAGGQSCFKNTSSPCTSPLVQANGGAGGPGSGGQGATNSGGTAGDLLIAGGMGGATLGYHGSDSPYMGGSPGGAGARGGGGGAGGGTGYPSGTSGNGVNGQPFGGGGGGAGNRNTIATGGTGGAGGIIITAYPN